MISARLGSVALRRRRRLLLGDRDLPIVAGSALGPVRLGMAERDVRALLGRPESQRDDSRWWAMSSLRVDLDEQGRVEFVEVCHDEDFGWRTLYDGRDLLATPAEEVTAVLHREQPRYEEDGYSLTCATGLALWRPVKPEDVQNEPEDEYRDGRCWSSLAVAAPAYWSTEPVPND